MAQLAMLWLRTKFEETSQVIKNNIILDYLEGKNIDSHTGILFSPL